MTDSTPATAAAWILVPCPTCGVEARKRCESDPVMVGFVHMARHDLAVITTKAARSVRRD